MFRIERAKPKLLTLLFPQSRQASEINKKKRTIQFADSVSREYPLRLFDFLKPFQMMKEDLPNDESNTEIDLSWVNADVFDFAVGILLSNGDPHDFHEHVSGDCFTLYEECEKLFDFLLISKKQKASYLHALENISVDQAQIILQAYEAQPGKSEAKDPEELPRLVKKAQELRWMEPFFEDKEGAYAHLNQMRENKREKFALEQRLRELKPCLANDTHGFVRQQKELAEKQLSVISEELKKLSFRLPPHYGDMRANYLAAHALEGDAEYKKEAAARIEKYKQEVTAVLREQEADLTRFDLLEAITGPHFLFNYYGLRTTKTKVRKQNFVFPSEQSELYFYRLKNKNAFELETEIRDDLMRNHPEGVLPPLLFVQVEDDLTEEQRKLRAYIGDRFENWSVVPKSDIPEITERMLQQVGIDLSQFQPKIKIVAWETLPEMYEKGALPSMEQQKRFYLCKLELTSNDVERYSYLAIDKNTLEIVESFWNPSCRGIEGLKELPQHANKLEKDSDIFQIHELVIFPRVLDENCYIQ